MSGKSMIGSIKNDIVLKNCNLVDNCLGRIIFHLWVLETYSGISKPPKNIIDNSLDSIDGDLYNIYELVNFIRLHFKDYSLRG